MLTLTQTAQAEKLVVLNWAPVQWTSRCNTTR